MYKVEGGEALKKVLVKCIQNNLSVLISGAPGIGKSLPSDEKVVVIRTETSSPISIPISDVKKGDRVIGLDSDNNVKVTEVKYKVAFEHEGDVLVVRTRSGKVVRATPDHSFLVLDIESGKFIPCKGSDLKEGDIVPRLASATEIVSKSSPLLDKIVSIEKIPYKGLVYDLETETHNFLTAQGIFVHNSEIFFQAVSEVSETFTVMSPSEIRLYLMEPGEAKGIPWLVEKKTVWSRPDWLPEKENTVLFFDDIHLVNEYNQSPLYELLLCRRLHGHAVPESTRFVAAGNIGLSTAGASEIMAPIMDRFDLFVEYTPTLNDFTKYAISQEVDNRIITFLSSYGVDYLYTIDPGASQKFPSPRSWFSLDRILKAGFPIEVAPGVVGVDAGSKLVDAWSFLSQKLDDLLSKNLKDLSLKDQVAAAAYLSAYKPTDRILLAVKKLNPDARACYFRLVLTRFPDQIGFLYHNKHMREIANELAAILGD